jgi:sialic acid synthase SpsE
MIFVVAEIGVNWDGDFDLVREIMFNVKKAGGNAVKFQAFNEEIVKNHSEKFRLLKSAVTKTNVETINELAKSNGIEWFCTPMYPDAVDFLQPFVKRFKVRELDGRPLLENKTTELLEKLFETKREIMISSQTIPKNFKINNNYKIKWLYCVPKYPCKLSELDFRKIKDFNGYSNHCPHIIAPLTAAILGSEIIEVHITPDKNSNFTDNPVSFDYNELKGLIDLIRLSEEIQK